jgi:tetratricopeptide (TPR) repeat protein
MLQNHFTSWDDPAYITKNAFICKLNAENVKYIFTKPIAINYHPLTLLSLALNYACSGLDPFSYYLTNLILHLFNVCFVFWFIWRLSSQNIHVTAFATFIFAIHPMHVESVAWAAERKDVLYTFFFVPALISYLYFLDTRRWRYYILSMVLAVCSMSSKPAAIIFPLLMVALDVYKEGRFQIRSLKNKIPFLAISAFFMYMTLVAQTMNHAVIGEFKIHTPLERLLFASHGFIIYIIKFFVPYQLAAFHPYPEPISALVYLSPLLLLALLVGITFSQKRRRLFVFGLLFYLSNLILVLQFFSIGEAAFAERYTYVPYLAICFVLGMVIFSPDFRLSKQIVWAILGVFLGGLSVAAHARVKVWNNDETLWTDLIKKYPACDRGYYNRGVFYQEKKLLDKAFSDFSKALTLNENYRTYSNRGQIFLDTQQYGAAVSDFSVAIARKPDKEKGFLGRAYALEGLGKHEESIKDFSAAIGLNATFYEAYVGRGYAYLDLKQLEAALADAHRAVTLKPGSASYSLRAAVYIAMQRYEDAVADYQSALTLTQDVSLYGAIGYVYYRSQNYALAIEQYSQLLSREPNHADTRYNRSASYFMLRQFDKAILDAKQAIDLDSRNPRHYLLLASIYDKLGDKLKAQESRTQAAQCK